MQVRECGGTFNQNPTVKRGSAMVMDKSISTPFHVCITPRLFGPGSGVHTPILLHCKQGATQMKIQCMKNTPSSCTVLQRSHPALRVNYWKDHQNRFKCSLWRVKTCVIRQVSQATWVRKSYPGCCVCPSLFLPTLYGPLLFHFRKIKPRITIKIDTAMTRLILDVSRHPRF